MLRGASGADIGLAFAVVGMASSLTTGGRLPGLARLAAVPMDPPFGCVPEAASHAALASPHLGDSRLSPQPIAQPWAALG